MPFIKEGESSVEYFFASSSASSITTLCGASFINTSSAIDILKISLSILNNLSKSQPKASSRIMLSISCFFSLNVSAILLM